MVSNQVCIASYGARTSLGLRAATSAAALRAGLSRITELDFIRDRFGEPMNAAVDGVLPPTLFGPDRLLALAEDALLEACQPLASLASPPKVPLLLGLPEHRPGFGAKDASVVEYGLSQLEGLPVVLEPITCFPRGHAAGLLALEQATRLIEHGACELCLVGGIDSYLQPETLEWLDAHRQMASANTRSAFVPGEGAGFCLLMRASTAHRLGLNAPALVTAVAVGHEPKRIKSPQTCLGEGLTTTVRAVVDALHSPAQRVDMVFCDINGERYRGEEWGFVALRLAHYFHDPTAYRSPASGWGDTGAASGPLLCALACEAGARGYAQGTRTVLWCSSEAGTRGAALLEVRTR